MVFIDEPWGETSVKAWDASSWDERLSMCRAEKKIDAHEHVIPVCSRVLKFDLAGPAAKSGGAPIYASNSDPAIASHSNIQTWSRPMLDTSRILILYTHHHATPMLAHLHAVEHDSRCTTFPTPGDPSLTAVPNWQNTALTVFGRKSNCDAPPLSARPGSAVQVPSNAELVLALLYIWNRGRVPIYHHHHHYHHHHNNNNNNNGGGDLKFEVFDDWEAHFGRTKILWQEVEDRIHSHSLDAHKAMLEFWPKD